MDAISKQRAEELHPEIKDKVLLGISKADEALKGRAKMRIVQGLRDFAYQNKLYAQRPKVTNAKGGQSYHNYGLAIDFCLIIDGKEVSWDLKKDWDADGQADWLEVVKIFEDLGFTWGKAFNDMPHLEYTKGLHWSEMLKRYNAGDFITGTKFIRL